MTIHQTSLSCGCNVDYSGQRCRFHDQAGNKTIGIVAAQFAPPCEAVIARFVFGGQTCDEPAVGRVRCPDDACGSRPHSHAACGVHGGAS